MKTTMFTLLASLLLVTGCQAGFTNQGEDLGEIGLNDESGEDINQDIEDLDLLDNDLKELEEIDLTDILLNDF